MSDTDLLAESTVKVAVPGPLAIICPTASTVKTEESEESYVKSEGKTAPVGSAVTTTSSSFPT